MDCSGHRRWPVNVVVFRRKILSVHVILDRFTSVKSGSLQVIIATYVDLARTTPYKHVTEENIIADESSEIP
jgi:hypothetical protein